MKLRYLFFVFAFMLFIYSCGIFDSGASSSSSSQSSQNNISSSTVNSQSSSLSSSSQQSGVGIKKPSDQLSQLPDFKTDVPDSLGGNALKLKLKNDLKLKLKKLKLLDYGDVSQVNPSSYDDVKSQGWYDLVKVLTKPNAIIKYVEAIKSFASSNTNIPFNIPIYIGTQKVVIFDVETNIDFGYILCRKKSDYSMDIFWSIPTEWEGFYTFVYFFISNDVNGKSKVGMLMDNSFYPDYIQYSYYDEEKNEIIDYNQWEQGSYYLVKSKTIPGDGTYIYTKNSWAGYSYNTTAWGNNEKGGVMRNYSYFDQFQNEYIDYIDTEFYNSNGSLIFKNSGSTKMNDYSYFYYYTNYGINLYSLGYNTPPDNIIIIYKWIESDEYFIYTNVWYEFMYDLDDMDYYNQYHTFKITNTIIHEEITTNNYYALTIISNNSGLPITNKGLNLYGLYFRKGSDFSYGDCVYYVQQWEDYPETNGSNIIDYGDYQETNYNITWYSIINLVIGEKIPSPINYLGKNYFVYNQWPLKYLKLEDKYSNYQFVKMEKGSYYWTNVWYDYDYETYQEIPKYEYFSWIDYDYWLDKDGDNQYTNIGDIKIENIQQENVYLMDPDTYEIIPQKAYFVNSLENDPQYFVFPAKDLVKDVINKINAYYYNETINFNINSFIQSIPKFPPLSNFPGPNNSYTIDSWDKEFENYSWDYTWDEIADDYGFSNNWDESWDNEFDPGQFDVIDDSWIENTNWYEDFENPWGIDFDTNP